MTTLFLMVGLPGSGKTTLAKLIAAETPAVRLTPDDWIRTLYGPSIDGEQLDAVREPVEASAKLIAGDALRNGISVILDFGFWSRAERDEFRAWAASLGADTQIRYLPCTMAELQQRVAVRNSDLGRAAFHVRPEELERWYLEFEPPEHDEI